MSIKISTIIPLYNNEKDIDKAVNSVINQNYDNYEIIIIDDGSTDNSLNIAKQFESDKIKVFSKPNGGLVSAYKYGFNFVSGEYIAFLDSDDFFADSYFEKAQDIIEKYSPDFISFCVSYVNEKGDVIGEQKNYLSQGLYSKDKIDNQIIPKIILNNTKKGQEFPFVMNRVQKIYKKTLIDKFIEDLNEKCCQCEDNIFTVLSTLNADRIYVDNSFSCYNAFVRNNSMSRNISLKLWDKYLLAIETLKNIVIKYKHNELLGSLDLLAFDSARHTLNRCVGKGTKFKEVKPYFKSIVSNEYIIRAVKSKRIKGFRNKILKTMLKRKMYFSLYIMLKIV